MAIIHQSLYSWKDEKDDLGDLERLHIVLQTLPDEALMRKLELMRGKGRNDFPVRTMWNLLLAGIIFGHTSIASLLRELRRNKQLAWLCGFQDSKLPSAHNMSRFISTLLNHRVEIERMFTELSESLYSLLDGFGKNLAIDSKWLPSVSNSISKRKVPDGRSETDAKLGIKVYRGIKKDGTPWEKVLRCFGFKVHILADADYELPIAYEVTNAAASDTVEGKRILKKLKTNHPKAIQESKHLMADKGYDDTELIQWLKEKGIKAVIAKREMWKGEKERVVPGYEYAYYDESGEVYCYTEKGERQRMAHNGYEKKRDALRFKCPAKAYGISCNETESCRCKNIRIPLSTDRRIFTQVQRNSYKWKRFHKLRTSVERINSRLDGAYGFEGRRTRGLARTKLHIGLAMIIMLSIAVWRAENKESDKIRSLLAA